MSINTVVCVSIVNALKSVIYVCMGMVVLNFADGELVNSAAF